MKTLIAKASAALGVLALSATIQAASVEDIIIDRIKPVGKVCLQGDESCGSAVAAAAGGSARSGADIVASNCASCHNVGVLGAPKIGTGDWAARLDAKGLDMLVSNAINGIGSMPAMGTCGDCSDDDIKAAVEDMIAKSQ
ncbi:MAG TPA: c-type cytochrome [Marinobacterium sp.]|nr:c-type cytochrome [Marinobacterium sp.]